jgi:hypothetical protein
VFYLGEGLVLCKNAKQEKKTIYIRGQSPVERIRKQFETQRLKQGNNQKKRFLLKSTSECEKSKRRGRLENKKETPGSSADCICNAASASNDNMDSKHEVSKAFQLCLWCTCVLSSHGVFFFFSSSLILLR